MDMEASYFNHKYKLKNVVFYNLNSTDPYELIPILLLFFLCSALMELINIWRNYSSVVLTYRLPPSSSSPLSLNPSSEPSTQSEASINTNPTSSTLALLNPFQAIPADRSQLQLFRYAKLAQSCLAQLLYVFVGYLTMLAVMTYNVYILIAVLLGSGLGYFFIRNWYIDMEYDSSIPTVSSTEPHLTQISQN